MAGAAQTALHFVGDHERARPARGFAHGGREGRGQRTHATFALDRLEHDRRGLVA